MKKRKNKFHYRRFNKVYNSDAVSYTNTNMSQFYDISHSTFIIPSQASVSGVAYTSKPSEFDSFIENQKLATLTKRGLIIKPRRVRKGAFKEFRNTLQEIVPELKDLTDEDIERLIDERNTDVFDNV